MPESPPRWAGSFVSVPADLVVSSTATMSPRPKKKPAPDPLDDLRKVPASRGAPPGGTDAAAASDLEMRTRYDALLGVAVSLTSTLDLEGILNHIVDGIIRVTGCERGFLILRESDGTFSTFTGRYADQRVWDEGDARTISRTIVNRVVETHAPFISSDIGTMDDLKSADSIQAGRISAAVCLPLLHRDSLTGVIYADSSHLIDHPLDSDDPVLRFFSAQAALAVENGRRHGEVTSGRDRLEQQNLSLRRQLAREFSMSGMVSRNKAMLEIFEMVGKIAPHDIPVLIQGESGTGKELLAQAIHDKSRRAERLMLPVNCVGMPAGLVESILFGHRKGAFTGADFEKPGVFELVDGGTLFLDEIGDMPIETQPKLLRVLESRQVSRLGEDGRLREVNVRVVSATNVDLALAVREKRFRDDLFHRLGGAHIMLPPLRDRREDIIPLAEHFLGRYAEERGVPRSELSRDARALLLASPWTGNVRQLKRAIEYGIAFQDDSSVVHAAPIERYLRSHEANPLPAERFTGTLKAQAEQFEERVVRQALAENGNNVSKAASALGISRQQLHAKIRKYDINTRDD